MSTSQPEPRPPARPPGRWDCLGVAVDELSRSDAVEAIYRMLSQPDGQWIATLNPEIVHYAWHNPALAGALKTASLALADGIGLVWANRLHGGPLRERVTGVDLLEVCLEHCAARSWPVFFLGAVPGVAAEAARRAARRWPGLPVVGTHHGYFDSADGNRVIRSIQAAAPRLVAVGMGHPRQEIWLAENMSAIAGAVGLACGGSLDILAGKAQRAPEWVQRANIEWLYRVLAAPRVRLRRSSRLLAFGLRMVKLWAWTKSRAGHPGRGADGHGRTT